MMQISLCGAHEDFDEVYSRYVRTVYKIAYIMMKSTFEAEDVTQNVFIKLFRCETGFKSEEHLKSWLIVVTKNECRDALKSWWNSKRSDMEKITKSSYIQPMSDNEILRMVMKLPKKYKLPVYLYYYEGYSTEEISKLLSENHATIRTRLKTARKKLKLVLEEDE